MKFNEQSKTGASLATVMGAIALSSITIANAALINFSFSNSNGSPITTEAVGTLEGPEGSGLGQTWNQSNTSTGSNLLDSTGVVTTVGYNTSVNFGWNWSNPDLKIFRSARIDFGKGNDTTHTINGLTPGNLYNVWLASGASNSEAERFFGTWTTTNTTTSAVTQTINNSDNNTTSFVLGNNYVLFENVVADGTGEIAFFGDAADLGEGPDQGLTYRLGVSGFQIQDVIAAIPEPSTTALLGLGGLALIFRRRK